jgi:uncharacterized repeat protein (TIGR01451 family)
MIDLLKNKFMNIIKPPKRQRQWKGQGLVEFALALPILLVVVYGLIETGRLLFIYGSTVTAARQAARYGSATGISDTNIPFYRDCDGIDSAARNTAFLSPFNDINVTYDRGLDSSGNEVAIPGISPDPTADTCPSMTDTILRNGDRIKVQVTTEWAPILSLIPSWQGFTITSEAERTILKTIPIGFDPDSEIWDPTGDLNLVVVGEVENLYTTFNAVGQRIYYSYILTNTVSFPLNAPFVVSDNIVTNENCLSSPATLATGASYTCTGSYVITQADIDTGYVTNLVSASSVETTTNTTGTTIYAVQDTSLTLTKTVSPTVATDVGDTVTYTYTLTNSGNVTLIGPYTVTDNKISSSDIDCSGAAATLLPLATTQCTATYTITADDVANASVTNTASVKAFFGAFEVTSNIDSAIVNTSPLDLKIATSVSSVTSLNQQIDYVYTVTNVGSTPLNGPYGITDDLAVNLSCSAAGSLAPGDSFTCTGEYYVTQANLDAGTDIVNHAIATSDGGDVYSNMATASVEIDANPSISLTINPPDTSGGVVVGTVLNYTYVITNTGNSTLSAPYTVDELNLPITPNCPATGSLPPNGTITCTLSHTVVQSDLDKGSIINLAIARATYGSEEVTSAQATAYVITYVGSRLSLSIISTPTSFQNRTTPLAIEFVLRNTGSVSLTSPYTISTNGFLGTVSCSGAISPLPFGQQTTCTVYYTPTSADLATASLSITGTATAKYGAVDVTSSPANLTILSSFVCSASHSVADITFPRTNQMAVDITNGISSSDSITLNSIQLSNWNFNTPGDQYISSLVFGGVQIYTGSSANAVNPFSISAPFSGNVTIAPGQTKSLIFAFNKNYNDNGNELITITFAEYGCTTVVAGD